MHLYDAIWSFSLMSQVLYPEGKVLATILSCFGKGKGRYLIHVHFSQNKADAQICVLGVKDEPSPVMAACSMCFAVCLLFSFADTFILKSCLFLSLCLLNKPFKERRVYFASDGGKM